MYAEDTKEDVRVVTSGWSRLDDTLLQSYQFTDLPEFGSLRLLLSVKNVFGRLGVFLTLEPSLWPDEQEGYLSARFAPADGRSNTPFVPVQCRVSAKGSLFIATVTEDGPGYFLDALRHNGLLRLQLANKDEENLMRLAIPNDGRTARILDAFLADRMR